MGWLWPFTAAADLTSGAWWRSNGITIAIVIVFALIVSRLGTLLVRRVRARIGDEHHRSGPLEARRVATITGILVNLIRVVLWTSVTLIVLSQLGVNITPLLASAGIVGIALSFGAQSLVRDFFSGFFILLEDQLAVGDIVDLAVAGSAQSITGRVETMTLRSIAVRSPDGTLAITGNGNIITARNLSRGRGRFEVTVDVPAGHHVDDVRARLERSVEDLRAADEVQRLLVSGPDVVGVVPKHDGTLYATVAATASASDRQDAEQLLSRRLAQAMLASDRTDGKPATSDPPR